MSVDLTVYTSSSTPQDIHVTVHGQAGETIATASGQSDAPFAFTVPNPSLWAPGSPVLYNVTVSLGERGDSVIAYTGFRSVEKGTVKGVVRPLLNGEFIYAFGPLE
jgi:beta-galactosidase/beta-glucuronidase